MATLKFTVKTSGFDALSQKLAQASSKAEHAVAVRAEKDTSPFVPFLTGSLDTRTRVEGNYIIYPGPYAHFLYQGKVWVDPVTHAAGFMTEDGWKSRYGVKKIETDRNLVFTKAHHSKAQSHWFEASKAQNLDKWVKVADKEVKDGI